MKAGTVNRLCGHKWLSSLTMAFFALFIAVLTTLFLSLVLFLSLRDYSVPLWRRPTKTDLSTGTDAPGGETDPASPVSKPTETDGPVNPPQPPVRPKDGSLCRVSTITDQVYSGQAMTPDVTVKDGERILRPGVDYHVTYQGGVDVGTATATVLFRGDYEGKLEQVYTVTPKDMSGEEKPLLENSNFYYTGEEITPYAVITDGNRELREGKDYDLIFLNNVNPGTGKMVVNYKGNYRGQHTLEFVIQVRRCKTHWFMLLALMLFVDVFVVCAPILKKKKPAFIACGTLAAVSAVLVCFAACGACYIVCIVNLLVAACAAVYTSTVGRQRREPQNYFN